ncbi:type II toxin-antitoxin system RelB/DinJ family antitoxin [Campylobacter vulpis]|uniref:type II toxin-antitoxin system RelB/DinJ family antitoxin n=1 Tax=Campylobacter vulpis TaxID=1655500 RepID=UPI001BCD2D45|nr:type II toxin-antitoxin system RelB/DinJ family antitoxin [Campylobacter vulpis]MBS4406138.1 type II toxin-antitoxin system RelB/DinJ family antitoxin [Campylobacter vulpis]
METINVTFRMNKKDKQEFEEVIKGLGLNLSSAFNVFAKAVINRNGLPFELKNRELSDETKRRIYNAEHNIDMEEVTIEQLKKEWEEIKRERAKAQNLS